MYNDVRTLCCVIEVDVSGMRHSALATMEGDALKWSARISTLQQVCMLLHLAAAELLHQPCTAAATRVVG